MNSLRKLLFVLSFAMFGAIPLQGWSATHHSTHAKSSVHPKKKTKKKKKKRAHVARKTRRKRTRTGKKPKALSAQPAQRSVAIPVVQMKKRLSDVDGKLKQLELMIASRPEYKAPSYQGQLNGMRDREKLLAADFKNLQRSKAAPAAALQDFRARLNTLETQIDQLVAQTPPAAGAAQAR
jgi:hypothetical protein